MSYLDWGIIILFAVTTVFYAVFFSLVYYWHRGDAKTVPRLSFVIVPLIFTFEFFLVIFLIISIIVLVLHYIPALINIF